MNIAPILDDFSAALDRLADSPPAFHPDTRTWLSGWMEAPHPTLGCPPRELLMTEEGILQVWNLLLATHGGMVR